MRAEPSKNNPASVSPERSRAREAPWLVAAALLSAVLLAAPFLYPGLFPLAWIALVPLLWLSHNAGTPRRAFLLAWFAGAGAHVIGFYWVEHTARVFGGFPHGLSEIILLGFALLASLPIACFGLLVRLCGLGALLTAPALLWVAIEFLWPQIFPWYLANSQSRFLVFIQSADAVGLYGASFLLVWFNALVYAGLFARAPGRRRLIAAAGVLLAALIADLLYGNLRLKTVAAEMRAARALDIAAIQGNVGIDVKWNAAYAARNLKTYIDLTDRAPRVDLYLWPESTVENWLPDDAERLPPEMLPALPPGSALVFGTISFTGRPNAPDMKVFNTVFAVDADGRMSGRYHKQDLLAFGEYLPLAPILSRIPGVPPIGGMERGAGPVVLDLPRGVKAAPLICYEDIMPELARGFVKEKGANLLVNLTNDAWFGNTTAPWQHARLAQWRAIETRRALVRVTNTGLTTVIDPKGEMRETLPLFAPGVLTAKVAIMEGETLYVKYGDWFAWLVVAGAVGVLFNWWKAGRKNL